MDTTQTASQAQEQAQKKAQEAAGQAKSRMRQELDQRSAQAGEQVSSRASDIRSVAEQLRQQGKDQPARLAEQAADRADRVGGYLKQSDADRILRDVEGFGRRQPMVVMLGGLALGFAASRFLKASSRRRYEGGTDDGTSREPRAALPPTTPSAAPEVPVPPGSAAGGVT
jgi:hypothetical protein